MICRHRFVLGILAGAAAFGIGTPLSALAGAVDEAHALVQHGDFDGALKKLDDFLAGSPKDADARFERGVVLLKLNRTQDAIKTFTDLAHDYPKLPEPYNNLAVIYAQQGDYEKARDQLEAALATAPSYATAHENLGDVYAALASAAYNRALMLDQNNAGVRYKLSLIGRLSGGATPTGGKEPAAMAVASTAPAPAPAAPAAEPPVVAEESFATTAAPAPAAATGEGDAVTTAATALVKSWAEAWASKNVDGYLSYYAADFAAEDGLSRSTWEQQRRERIQRPAHISVKVSKISIARVDATHLRATFSQDYRSDITSNHARKALDLADNGGDLKITREYTTR